MCWDRLVPPFSPEIIPVPLPDPDRYVLVVAVDPDDATRPVMTAQGNRFLVRIEGHVTPADWYRLRALFAEGPGGVGQVRHAGRSITAHPPPHLAGAYPLVFGVRGELWLTGPGPASYITESAREAVVDALRGGDCSLTPVSRTLGRLMGQRDPGWRASPWRQHGRGTTRRFAVAWHAPDGPGRRIAEPGLAAELQPVTSRHANVPGWRCPWAAWATARRRSM